MGKHAKFDGTQKFYYLYRAAIGTKEDPSKLSKGIPAVTVCISKDPDGIFFRGISVASPAEKTVSRRDGRNRAHGKMMKAVSVFKRNSGIKDFSFAEKVDGGSARDQINDVMVTGPLVDNPEKYSPDVCKAYWVANAEPSEFEKKLIGEKEMTL